MIWLEQQWNIHWADGKTFEKLRSIVSEVISPTQLPQHFTHDLFYGAVFCFVL